MAGIRIYWDAPLDTDVAKYRIFQGLNASAVAFIDEVQHVKPGPNWMESLGRFYYDDPNGTAVTYYQVLAIAQSGVTIADTGVFQPGGPVGAGLATLVSVDHNYTGTDAFQFVTQSGVGIPDATIRIFTQADFMANKTTTPLFVIRTLGDGRWERPAYLEPGLNYVLTFDKASAFTASPVTITV